MYKKRCRVDIIRPISSLKSAKKGQVTLFIILGLVLIIAIALVFLVQREIVTFNPGELVPTQKGSVESFITQCIEELGEDVLFQIGQQGGYLNVPEYISDDANWHIKRSPFHMVPLWAYGLEVRHPSLTQIKKDVDTYIEEHLAQCLFSSESFQETYDIIEKSSVTSDTEFAQSKTLFNVRWDIEVRTKSGEVVTELIDHVGESPIRFKQIFETAVQIIQQEMAQLKFEDITQDLIALEHENVPVAGMALSCSKKEWNVNEAKESLQELLRVNIKEVKVKGTEYVEFPEELPYYSNHYVWDIGEDFQKSDINVQFNFDQSHPFTFGVTPISGTKMRSSQLGGSDILSAVCIQTWKFTYDTIYPVSVRIRDDPTGYNFNLAFSVHLIENRGDRSQVVARESHIVPSATDEDFCKSKTIPMTVKTYELVENKEGVSVRNDLGGVGLSYTCLRYSCDMEQTKYDFGGLGFAGVTSNYPYCTGGILRGEKEGYKEDWQRVVTKANEEIELNLRPTVQIPLSKFRIVKHELNEQGQPESQEGLSSSDIAFVKLIYTRDEDVAGDPFHEESFVVSRQLDPKLTEGDIELLAKADFTYELDVSLLKDERAIGGYQGNWTIEWDELLNSQEITVHVAANEDATENEQFATILSLRDLSKNVPEPQLQ